MNRVMVTVPVTLELGVDLSSGRGAVRFELPASLLSKPPHELVALELGEPWTNARPTFAVSEQGDVEVVVPGSSGAAWSKMAPSFLVHWADGSSEMLGVRSEVLTVDQTRYERAGLERSIAAERAFIATLRRERETSISSMAEEYDEMIAGAQAKLAAYEAELGALGAVKRELSLSQIIF